MTSRFRFVAAAIVPMLVLAACNSSARPSPSSAAPSTPAASVAAPSQAAAASPGTKFKGIIVNLLTFNGPQVAEPLQRRAPDWEQLTGGHTGSSAATMIDTLSLMALYLASA